MSISNFDSFMRKFNQVQKDARDKPRQVAQEIALAVERQAKINASTGSHKRGQPHIPGTGPGPNRVTNTLRDSIVSAGRPVGFDGYQYVVGPTASYAKTVEFGSYLWKKKSDGSNFLPGQGYPYFKPAVEGLRKMGAYDTIIKKVYEGSPIRPK